MRPIPRSAAAAVLLALPTAAGPRPEFLDPPRNIGPPDPGHAPETRAFQGIPSLAIAPEGRMWATWYAGKTPGEDANNYVVISTRGPGDASWTEALVIDPDGDGPVRAFDPEIWAAPDGTLWAFWAQSIGHDGTVAGVWAMTARNPDDPAPTWSEPVRITDGIMMCKPTVLSSGEWVLPASTWRKTDNSARLVVSDDGGKTWSFRGACHVPQADREFDEHMIIEARPGRLRMLVRTKYGIGESTSEDAGRTWQPLKPSALAHPSARFFIRTLASGNVLLVKHGPLERRIGRSHLTAYLSTDGGATWTGGLLLDERAGVSYPDGQQGPDGIIRIIYDYSRTGDKAILLAEFAEADVPAGTADAGTVKLRQTVSTP